MKELLFVMSLLFLVASCSSSGKTESGDYDVDDRIPDTEEVIIIDNNDASTDVGTPIDVYDEPSDNSSFTEPYNSYDDIVWE